jgi:hypothetical protein
MGSGLGGSFGVSGHDPRLGKYRGQPFITSLWPSLLRAVGLRVGKDRGQSSVRVRIGVSPLFCYYGARWMVNGVSPLLCYLELRQEPIAVRVRIGVMLSLRYIP